jgi:hypothetical protein
VPRILADEHRKKKRMAAALKFLERYHRDEDKFLDHIVTGDENCVSHFNPESKRQSLEWHHPRLPSKPRKFKQTLSIRKSWPRFFGTGKASFWLSSCRRAQPSTPKRTVQLWDGYGTPFKTDGGAYCQAPWYSCTPMCACMLLPELKQCFKSLSVKFFSIQHIVQTWSQMIFSCSQNWSNFLVADASKLMKKWRMPSRSELNGLAAEVYEEGIQKSSHAMTSAWMLVATM